MKNSRYILIASFVFSIKTFSQGQFKPVTQVGINQGVNTSYVSFSPAINSNFRNGYVGGINFLHISEEHLGILGEVNFTQKGWYETIPVRIKLSDNTFTDTSFSYDRELNYLEIPVMTHIELGKSKTNLFLNFGPSISVFLGNTIRTNASDSILSENYHSNKIGKHTELGYCLGAGIKQKTNFGTFSIEARLSNSLTHFFNGVFFSRSTNSVTAFKLSYMHDLVLKKEEEEPPLE